MNEIPLENGAPSASSTTNETLPDEVNTGRLAAEEFSEPTQRSVEASHPAETRIMMGEEADDVFHDSLSNISQFNDGTVDISTAEAAQMQSWWETLTPGFTSQQKAMACKLILTAGGASLLFLAVHESWTSRNRDNLNNFIVSLGNAMESAGRGLEGLMKAIFRQTSEQSYSNMNIVSMSKLLPKD